MKFSDYLFPEEERYPATIALVGFPVLIAAWIMMMTSGSQDSSAHVTMIVLPVAVLLFIFWIDGMRYYPYRNTKYYLFPTGAMIECNREKCEICFEHGFYLSEGSFLYAGRYHSREVRFLILSHSVLPDLEDDISPYVFLKKYRNCILLPADNDVKTVLMRIAGIDMIPRYPKARRITSRTHQNENDGLPS